MKHKQTGTHLWNRALALLMAVFVTVQLTVPAYAEMNTQPVEQDAAAVEMQLEDSEKPAEPEALPVEDTEVEAPVEDVAPAEDTEPAQDAAPVEDVAPVEDAEPVQDEPTVVSDNAKAAAPAIPGYTHVTGDTLEIGKYYMIVSQDRDGNFYALYPDQSGLTLRSGDAIVNADRTLVANLDVSKTPVTAKLAVNDAAIDMEKLQFTVEKQGENYAFKSRTEENLYLSFTDDQMFSNNPTYLVVNYETATNKHLIYGPSGRVLDFSKHGEGTFAQHNTNFWAPRYNEAPIYLYTKDGESEPIKPEDIVEGAPKPGTTKNQPFAEGTAGSLRFRIPAMITLKHQKDEKLNGRVVTAIDARWNHSGDACALDTLVSYSDDNGKNWNYNFANYFNDSTDAKHIEATAFIDPELVEGPDGTIYLMVDVFPGGVGLNTANRRPHEATGYLEVNGEKRLVLYTTATNQQIDNWSYYVGDFEGKFAPVYAKDNQGGQAAYYVDDHYYLYDANKEKMYCPQLGSSKFVHQNVFFYNAELHVLEASYLWVVTSKDGGVTWGTPMMLNPQVRPQQGTSKFYGVGPGAGLSMKDGTIMLTAYTHEVEKSSFIYSNDNGVTWKRSETVENPGTYSSESCLVEIDPNTVRQFYRDGHETLYYTDHTRDKDGNWKVGDPVNTGVTKTHRNQLSAINYSEDFYGRPVIMLSTATDGGGQRNNGKIYTFVLEDDKTMTLVNSHSVEDSISHSYGYSSIAELDDGSLAVLFEGDHGIQYIVIPKADLFPEEKAIDLTCGETQVLPSAPKDTVINTNPDVVDVSNKKYVHVYNGAQGHTGTDNSYNGELAPLSDALFRFIRDGETGNSYQITGIASDGTQMWLSTGSASSQNKPVSTSAENVTVENAGNGEFYLHCKDGYLYLYRSGDKVLRYDRFNRTDNACKFNIYRLANEGEQTPDIAGYVKVTDLNQIKDGDFYLITATVNGATYALKPSTDMANTYSYNLKLDTAAPVVPEASVYYYVPEFTMTAKKVGTAGIHIGSTIYRVTVSHKAGTAWQSDANGHWHLCDSCGDKFDEAAHTYEDTITKQPTCKEEGAVTHTCTVCGYTYEEKLPVVAHQYTETVTKEPTCTEEGVKTYTCTACGDSYTEAIPVIKHTLEHVSEVPATTEATGVKEHWKCTKCGTLFSDAEGKVAVTEDELVIDKLEPEKPVGPVNPDKPVDPNKPVEPNKPADKDPGHVTPPTGDSTPVFLWSVIAIVCGACIVTLIVYRKKKNHN